MENVKENQVDSTHEASGTPENDKQDMVAYESYKKSVEAEKNARKRAQELEAQLEQIKMQELEKAGKHEEIIESLRNKNLTLEKSLNDVKQSHLWDKVTGEIKTKSLEHGCIAPDKLLRLLNKDDFSSLQGEDGSLRLDSVNALVEQAKKENPFLFNRGRVEINDVKPSFNGVPEEKSFSQMNPKEKLESLKANIGKAFS